MENQLIKKIPFIDSTYLVQLLEIFSTFKKDHLLWQPFGERILNIDLSREEIYSILKAFNLGRRERTKVWSHILDKYLIGKAIFLQMNL
jgi:hypothetical protein